MYKLQSSDQILAEMFQAGGGTLWPEVHKFIISAWIKEELPDWWKECVVLFCKDDETIVIVTGYHCYHLNRTVSLSPPQVSILVAILFLTRFEGFLLNGFGLCYVMSCHVMSVCFPGCMACSRRLSILATWLCSASHLE
jgi:hypothetical protein